MGEEERLKDYIKSLSPYLYDEEHYLENDIEDVLNKLDLYKEVIEEVREEIEKSILIEGVKETGVGYYENIKVNKTKLLQILDKVKGE